jgi:hypothetical protein
VASGSGDGWSGCAFGLQLAGTLSLEGVAAAPAQRRPDTWLEAASRIVVDRRWRGASARTLHERRLTDGSVGLSIQHDGELGYRVWAPRHGCYLVAPDGAEVLAAPPSGPAWRWERLVLAQVLPLAALLQGRELLHASAVEVAGRAIAFFGGSGVGKTTLAARLVARGARLLTDDVLAVDMVGRATRAHRGGITLRIDPRELRGMSPSDRQALGAVRARGEKWHVAPRLAPAQLPLRLTYHLLRPADVGTVEVVAVRPYDPGLLLGSAFLNYLTGPQRLRRQIEVCSAIAGSAPLYQVRASAYSASADVADAVVNHARALLGEFGPR